MKTHGKLAFTLAIALIITLFAGCGGTANTNSGDNSTATPAPTVQTTEQPPTPTEEPSPYNYAAGKYAVNSEGFPTEKYVYELPLTTTDEVFTQWTTCYTPQYIPEDGWASIGVWAGLREMTGVTIEYDVVASATRGENFSVLLASDALEDIMDQALSFFKGGTALDAINDEYFVNLYDYRDYMPCYMYETYSRSSENMNIIDKVFYNKTTIAGFYGMLVEPTPSMGLIIRQDWLDSLGLGKAIDITTYDELTEAMTAFKTADETRFPLWIPNTITQGKHNYLSCGFNTFVYTADLSFKRIVNGKVEFCGTTEDDREAMTLFSSWFSKGFIDYNFAAHTSSYDSTPQFSKGEVGVTYISPSQIAKLESTNEDPNCRWDAMKMMRKTEGQVLKYGLLTDHFNYGSTYISTKCENIPLAVTWVDWWYSDEGSEYTSWGVEGVSWEYDSNGKRMLTDFITQHEAGQSWALTIFATNGLVNAGLFVHKRGYAVPNGERFLAIFDIWEEKAPTYSGEYDFPAGVKLDTQQSSEATAILADLNTYYSENYVSFLDGSKPMSEWDNFQKGMKDTGLDALQAIYQEAYDSYLAYKNS
jgi:putative aldouronate transport system substrate-binding protein